VPKIDLLDDELAAVIAAIRPIIETDRYPRVLLRAALARFDAAAEPAPHPPAKADKRARR
jgi:hypothetical protein